MINYEELRKRGARIDIALGSVETLFRAIDAFAKKLGKYRLVLIYDGTGWKLLRGADANADTIQITFATIQAIKAAPNLEQMLREIVTHAEDLLPTTAKKAIPKGVTRYNRKSFLKDLPWSAALKKALRRGGPTGLISISWRYARLEHVLCFSEKQVAKFYGMRLRPVLLAELKQFLRDNGLHLSAAGTFEPSVDDDEEPKIGEEASDEDDNEDTQTW